MKRVLFVSLVGIVLASLILAACASPAPAPSPTATPTTKPTSSPTATAPAQKINLSFTTYWPEASTQYKGTYKPILDAITAKSGGRVTWTTYLGGALGGGNEIYDAVRTGKADMGSTGVGYTPGRFPLHEVFSLPGCWNSTRDSAENSLVLLDRYLSKEFVGTEPISLQQTQTFFIYTAKKAIKTTADLKGLKIRSTGGNTSVTLQTLGMEPVLMPLGDVYLSLQTGLVDGAVTGPSAFPGFKLGEVMSWGWNFPIAHGANIMFYYPPAWAKVPADIQKIIKEESKFFAYGEMDLFTQDNPTVTKLLTDKGGGMTKLSDAETQQVTNNLKVVFTKWVDECKTKKAPVDEFLPIVREEAKKHNVPFPY